MAELTVAAGVARGLLDLAVAKGANRQVLAQRAAIDLSVLEDQDNRVPFASYVALMRAFKRWTGVSPRDARQAVYITSSV